MSENGRHLDLAALDAVRAGDAAADEAQHALECSECRAELKKIRALAGDLRNLSPTSVEVPPEVDRAILSLARRRQRVWIPFSAAAAVVIVVILALLMTPAAAPGDIDGSGTVDIVDAYTLARRIESGASLDRSWDFNRDGTVNEKDVDAIAMRSVSINGRRNP
ncbi:MAG: dockerin type I domain-containing protein [Planctomycetota bacterium]|jgi:predicted anti-sigma-YlaC factor YlaD